MVSRLAASQQPRLNSITCSQDCQVDVVVNTFKCPRCYRPRTGTTRPERSVWARTSGP